MTTIVFNQASNTQLTTLGFTSVGHGSFADPTNFVADGSNRAWMNAAFKGGALVYTSGNGPNDKGEGTIVAGTTSSIGNNLEHHVCTRMAVGSPGTLGYSAFPRATVGTVVDEMRVRRNFNGFVSNIPLSPTVDLATTDLTYSIRVVNTVDLEVIVNGTTYTLSGSGGNDFSGAAVLTGGNPGLAILNNLGVAAGGFKNWTDGVSAPASLTVDSLDIAFEVQDVPVVLTSSFSLSIDVVRVAIEVQDVPGIYGITASGDIDIAFVPMDVTLSFTAQSILAVDSMDIAIAPKDVPLTFTGNVVLIVDSMDIAIAVKTINFPGVAVGGGWVRRRRTHARRYRYN